MYNKFVITHELIGLTNIIATSILQKELNSAQESWLLKQMSFNTYYRLRFCCGQKKYSSFGIKNKSGGYETIFSLPYSHTVTLFDKNISFFKSPSSSHSCCLFYDFVDYLAFLALRKTRLFNFPIDSDIIIMSDPLNFSLMTCYADDYERINIFMPCNLLGDTISCTLEDRYKKKAVSYSILYRSYRSLYDFVKQYRIINHLQ